jgi:general secretion pathway protein A
MYEDYWGLTSAPFANRLRVKPFYASPIHEEALARLLYAVEQGKSLAVLHGPAGCGKSQVLHVLAAEIRRTQRYLGALSVANLGECEFLIQLEKELRLGGTEGESSIVRWRRIHDFFQATWDAGLQTVLLVDGLEHAEDATVACIGRLVRLGQQSLAHLTVIAAFNRTKPTRPMKEFFELADMGVEVKPFERVETESYIHNRLESFGGPRSVFQADAIDQVQKATGGVPRDINRLCELALLAGMSESRKAIDRNLIASLAGENPLPE